MLHVRGVFKVFLERASKCDIVHLIVCFSGKTNLKQIEERMALGGLGACSPGKFLKYYVVQ